MKNILFSLLCLAIASTTVTAAPRENGVAVPKVAKTFTDLPVYEAGKLDADFMTYCWGSDADFLASFVSSFERTSGRKITKAGMANVESIILPRIKQVAFSAWKAADCPQDETKALTAIVPAIRDAMSKWTGEMAKLTVK